MGLKMLDVDKPDTTVIVLLYNDMPHGLNAIESVLAQTHQNIKIKILDNGSTDDTWSQIQQYTQDPRVQLFRNNINQKSEFAVSEALKTDTEYLTFLFADDIFFPERIALGLSFFQEDPSLDAVFFNNLFVDESGKPLKKVPTTLFSGDISMFSQEKHLQYFFFLGNSLHPCGMLIKTQKYMQLGGFESYYHRIGDMIFFTRLLFQSKVKFAKENMQKITVWQTGRNESTQNLNSYSKLSYELFQFLKQYTLMAISKPERLIKIFGTNKEVNDRFQEDADALWYIGHQAVTNKAPVYRLFAFDCFYQAAQCASKDFHQKINLTTGKTIPQYLDWLGSVYPPFETIYGKRAALKYLVASSIPFSKPIYRIIKNLFQKKEING